MYSKLLPKAIIATVTIFLASCANRFDTERFSEQYQKLSSYYEQLLIDNPDDLDLRMKLAQFYYDFRDYQKAKDVLKHSQTKEERILLAKILVKLKEYDYAIEIFEQLKIDPASAPHTYAYSEYFYLYGEVLENKNLFPKAIEIYKKIKGAFKQKALARIGHIKLKIEDTLPPHITSLSSQAQNFLEEVKDEAAIIYFVDEKTEITEENSSVSTIHVIEQILQERAKELGEIDIGYDSTYERVELELARVISKDGKVVYAGKENIRDVSRYLNFPLYSNSRALIISMPLVEVGAFIEYKIKIYSSKLINEDDFSFIYRLRERYPIFKAKFTLTLPQQRKINFKFFNYISRYDENKSEKLQTS